MPKIDISTQKPEQGALPANLAHLLGPLKPGTPVTQAPDGSFVPVQLPQDPKVQAQVKKIEEEVKKQPVKLDPTLPTLSTPEPIDMASLSPEKQEAIMASLKEAKEKLAGLEKKSVEQAKDPTQVQKFAEEIRKVREPDISKPSSGTAGLPGNSLDAGGTPAHTQCQHCGWDLNRADPEEPDPVDKLNFTQAILGQVPFRKVYSLMGGKVRVEFRNLTSEESSMTFTQIAFDAGRGAILDENEYFKTLNDYRLCLGLARVWVGSEEITLPDTIDDWHTDPLPPKATKLIHIVPYIYKHVLKTESLRRGVAATFFRFQRLAERIEAHFDDPNFWQAIDRPA